MKAALYIRVSTEEQAMDGYSLDAQEKKLLAYCTDVADDVEVYDIYRDDGYSGRNTNRPGYKRMMEDIDEWDLLLVLKMDRLHRNFRNFILMMDELNKRHKDFRSATEEFDTTTAMGRFVINIIQGIAQLESEQNGERTRFVMEEKAVNLRNTEAESRTLGFNPPFGYGLDKGLLIPVPEEQEVVKRIYSEYLENQSLAQLADGLNRDGLRTRRGTKWSKDNLSTILHNPIYAGYLKWSGILCKHYATAPISVITFNEVQTLAASRSRNPNGRKADIIREEDGKAELVLSSVDEFADF
ncbi:MAG: recombinase family protein [Candidatus Methanomethylophilus sp.]|nr:recombinase family protein [Methanomethylophilus sp.]